MVNTLSRLWPFHHGPASDVRLAQDFQLRSIPQKVHAPQEPWKTKFNYIVELIKCGTLFITISFYSWHNAPITVVVIKIIKPAIAFKIVLLPAPLAPRMATISSSSH